MAAERAGNGAAWTGFLAASFGVVGLVGAFAIFAAQIPFDRAAARSQALDRVVSVSRAGDVAALAALRPQLGDSADRVLGGTPDGLPARVEGERARMLLAFHAEAVDDGVRLRLVLAVFTAAAALFGAAVLGIVRRG